MTVLLISAVAFTARLTVNSTSIKLRPYAGIGILKLPFNSMTTDDQLNRMVLYDEPAMTRIDRADLAQTPRHQWIFAMDSNVLPLIVMARRGQWLKVLYDDADREGWIRGWRPHYFRTWEELLGRHTVRLLPGIQKRYYRICILPGSEHFSEVTPEQLFRVTGLDGDWLRIENKENLIGWLRWRDEDGRLLISLEDE